MSTARISPISMADLHPDVVLALRHWVGEDAVIGTIVREEENADYAGAVVHVGGLLLRARVGRSTPTKVGHFVTVWGRDDAGRSAPFKDDDGINELLVVVRDDDRVGMFVLPTEVLLRRGIVAGQGSSGKRGFRVYAPWISVPSAQARRTQTWQGEHFQAL